MDLTSLPHDLFLLIVAYLTPKEYILCWRICSKWRDAFTSQECCRGVVLQHYPRAREVRQQLQLQQQVLKSNTTAPLATGTSSLMEPRESSWVDILTRVATRYHFLTSGNPRCIETLPIRRSHVEPNWCRNYAVAPWQKHLEFEGKRASFHHPDTLWTYDDGLLIFPSGEENSYVLYDLEEGLYCPIAWDPRGRVMRRMRLKSKVLLIEWCEGESYHKLNESEEVYRHFATAYDIVWNDNTGRWYTIFRNEWKPHFLGLTLNSRDRFFSMHDEKHYALYIWQPNRSAWGEDEPIEILAVWDISSPSSYRPSEDPSGKGKPDDCFEGPRVIRRLSFSDLDFYKIRQRSTPTFRGLGLDDNHIYFIEEDHRWSVGPHAGHNLPRIHKVKTTGIPFVCGPERVDECGSDGDVNMSFCEREGDQREVWRAPCWRHEEFPYLTITEAIDSKAGVRFCARHCFMLETLSINIKPKIQTTVQGKKGATDEIQVFLKDDLWQQLLGTTKFRIDGDERWLIGEDVFGSVVILHFDKGVVVKKHLQR